MSFEELFGRVGERANSDDHHDFMTDAAVAELSELRSLAQPITPGRHTPEENARIRVIECMAAQLHVKRWSYLLKTRTDTDETLEGAAAELYQAVLSLRSVCEGPPGPPPGFESIGAGQLGRQLYSAEPNPEVQGNIAYFLLANAPRHASRDYHAVAIDLLRAAMEAIPPDHPLRSEWQRLLDLADRRRRPVELDWEQIRSDEINRWLFAQPRESTISPADVYANWGEISGRVNDRLMRAMNELRPELLDESVVNDGATLLSVLLRSAQHLDSTEIELKRGQACHLNASVHVFRAALRSRDDNGADLARAVLFAAPVNYTETPVPGPAGSLVGRDARPETQLYYASEWLHEATYASADPALVGAVVILFIDVIIALPPGDPSQASSMANLAATFGLRYDRTGARVDLERAIGCAENALAITAEDDPYLPPRRGNLGTLYMRRARLTRMLADHNRALEVLEGALSITTDDSPGLALLLLNLGIAHSERRRLPKRQTDAIYALANTSDLMRAIKYTERGLAVGTDPEVVRELRCNLGVQYFERYQAMGEHSDIELAITTHEQNLADLDVNDPTHLMVIAHLANAYDERFTANGTRVASEVLHTLSSRIESPERGLPYNQVWAWRNLGMLAARIGETAMATDLLRRAVELLSLVSSPENDWEDRERLAGEHMGLINNAIAVYCEANDWRGAVDIAELGRDAVLPTLVGAQTDLNALEAEHPDIANELHGVRRLLNRPHGTLLGDNSEQIIGHTAYQVGQRVYFQSQYRELLDRIRRISGFERFLLPASQSWSGQELDDGSVILVNADRLRSDAVIIPPDGDPKHVPLPQLTIEDVIAYGRKFLHSVHFAVGITGALRKQRVVSETLAWLWATVAEPVLAAVPRNSRIWWMPTSALSMFPLHASGIAGEPGVLDLAAASSYTPTLAALAAAKTRVAASVRTQLSVALERTPGLPDLPSVVQEADALRAQFPDAPYLRDRTATTDRVMHALREATWAHFACHAAMDFAAPSRGGLYLYDGVLSVPEISSLHLRQAEFVYLSACSSAGRGVRHADQSISIASAFQLIGFRHVVASLWPLQDSDAAKVASMFYERMPGDPTADAAPNVLRDIVIDLRQAEPNRPDLWAPLIHLGP